MIESDKITERKAFVSAEKLAGSSTQSLDSIIRKIKTGEIVGVQIDGRWYVEEIDNSVSIPKDESSERKDNHIAVKDVYKKFDQYDKKYKTGLGRKQFHQLAIVRWPIYMLITLLILGIMPDSWGWIKGLVALALIFEFAVLISLIADLALSVSIRDVKNKWRD